MHQTPDANKKGYKSSAKLQKNKGIDKILSKKTIQKNYEISYLLCPLKKPLYFCSQSF